MTMPLWLTSDLHDASASREAATPPPTSPTLAAIVAERVADGDRVGVDDGDTLLEPPDGKDSALNVEATVAASSRRQKQVAHVKTTKAKKGDSETEPVPRHDK